MRSKYVFLYFYHCAKLYVHISNYHKQFSHESTDRWTDIHTDTQTGPFLYLRSLMQEGMRNAILIQSQWFSGKFMTCGIFPDHTRHQWKYVEIQYICSMTQTYRRILIKILFSINSRPGADFWSEKYRSYRRFVAEIQETRAILQENRLWLGIWVLWNWAIRI